MSFSFTSSFVFNCIQRKDTLLTRPQRAICHAMVNVVGVALHNKMLLSMSMDSAPRRQDKQHLGLRSRRTNFHIDKHSAHTRDSCLHNRVELPCRMSDGDCMLMMEEGRKILNSNFLDIFIYGSIVRGVQSSYHLDLGSCQCNVNLRYQVSILYYRAQVQ